MTTSCYGDHPKHVLDGMRSQLGAHTEHPQNSHYMHISSSWQRAEALPAQLSMQMWTACEKHLCWCHCNSNQQSSDSSCVGLQRQRPGSGTVGSSSDLGPGWYHVRHTAVEKQPHTARLKPHAARPASAGQVKNATPGTPHSQLAW